MTNGWPPARRETGQSRAGIPRQGAARRRADEPAADQREELPVRVDESQRRIDGLADHLRAPCAGVVDADEVAALLEAAGIGDRTARRVYRQPHLFALAEQVLKRLRTGGPPHRHAAVPLRWDWAGLTRPALIGTRLLLAAAITVAGCWLGGTVVVPVLVSVPLAELLIAWQQGHARWGLAAYDTTAACRRHLRAVGWATLLALVPPLLVAVALLGAGSRLAARSAAAPALAHAAAGVLLGGGYALILLLAACGRRVIVVGLVLVAIGATVLIRHASAPAAALGLLAAGYLAALVVAAYTVLDPDRLVSVATGASAGSAGRSTRTGS